MNGSAESLLITAKDTGGAGIFAEVSAAQAGWEYLNMAARRMNRGETWSAHTGDHEWAHVILGGVCHLHMDGSEYRSVGRRPNVFSGMPYAVYLPRGMAFEIEAVTDGFEVASCWVPTDRDGAPRLVTPKDCAIELRGGGNASRQINSIIPPGFGNHRIVAVEVYTPSGNWSSYPPHKHDVHREAADGTLLEADLEEIYFYKIAPADGFAYQRVYTDSRAIDAVMMAHQHDMVLVPEGYHPVVSGFGYTTYYLNFLAGSAQALTAVDDPQLAWVRNLWTSIDPRLPLVSHDMEA
ncbi:MAG: 5-deoxy-glucuronate isomerase [bacterium]|nr:5-deoxy-glucuronate isomerase [bacterium]